MVDPGMARIMMHGFITGMHQTCTRDKPGMNQGCTRDVQALYKRRTSDVQGAHQGRTHMPRPFYHGMVALAPSCARRVKFNQAPHCSWEEPLPARRDCRRSKRSKGPRGQPRLSPRLSGTRSALFSPGPGALQCVSAKSPPWRVPRWRASPRVNPALTSCGVACEGWHIDALTRRRVP